MLLVTGFPGFIAGQLLRRVLERNPTEQAVALVEPRMRGSAARVASELGAALGDGGSRIRLVEGDITQPGLGLPADVADELRAGMKRALHLAALYDLTVPQDLAERVNVEGTGNVLEFLESCDKPVRLGYFSTIQVAGNRTGHIYEHELQLGQGFGNHYEATKHRAEIWVRQRMDRIPTTIFRPATVVGDSRTGEISKLDGPYYALELIARLRALRLPLSYVGASKARFNIAPVDFVVDAAAHIFDQPEAVGLTFQLIDPEPVTTAEQLELFCRLWDGSSPRGRIPAAVAEALWRIPGVPRLTGLPRQAVRYFNHPTSYDGRNTQRFIEPTGIRCPSLPDYAPVMLKYFRSHRKDGPPPAPPAAADPAQAAADDERAPERAASG